MGQRPVPQAVARHGFDLAVSVLLIVVLGGALSLTVDMQFRGRLFPQAIIVPTLILALVQLGLVVRRIARDDGARAPAGPAEDALSARVEAQRTARLLAWLAFWLLGVWLVGFVPALSLGVLLYTLLEARRAWWQCALMGLGTWLFLIGFLDRLLHLVLPAGHVGGWPGG